MAVLGPIEPRTEPTTAFGAALRSWRERQGYSQGMLASLSGYDRSMICRLEQGTRDPSVDAATVLADALNLRGWQRVMFLSDAGFIETPLPESIARTIAAWIEATEIFAAD